MALTLTAGAYDLRQRRIPNWLVAAGVVAGFGLQLYFAGAAGLKPAAAGLGIALAVNFPLYLLRASGAGDVKLMAAIGAIGGPEVWLSIFLICAIAGGILALALAVVKRRLGRTLRNTGYLLADLARGRAPHRRTPELDATQPEALTLPRGAVVALATLLYLGARLFL